MDKAEIYYQLRKQAGYLFATHDLSVTNLKKALSKSGAPSLSFPSFAVQHLSVVNEDNSKVGFAGDSSFGDIRLVMDGSKLIRGHQLLDCITVFDANICSAMIPPVRYTINENDLWDAVADLIGEHPCLNELMEDLMDSVSDTVFDDGYVIFADFHSEFVRTTAMQFLFSKLVAKDGVTELDDFDLMQAQLESKIYRAYDPRFDDLILTVLDSATSEKGMVLDNEYIKIGDGVTESEIIEALFDVYPITEFGALARQTVARGEDERVQLEDTLLHTLFAKRFNTVYDIYDAKNQLINATGITPYNSDKSNYTSAIGQLRGDLAGINSNLLRSAFLSAFEKLTSKGSLTVEEIATVFADNGIIVDDKLFRSIERCIEYKEQKLQPFFEMKFEGECPMEFVSHIVVKDIIKGDVEAMLKASDLNIPVVGYSGVTLSELEWGRAMGTLSRDLSEIALLDRQGLSLDYEMPQIKSPSLAI